MAARSIADRYDLLEPLGRGGGGTVWRAHDRALDRVVALKEIVLDPGLPDDERDRVRARALREARAAARLEHRHVVSVYDVRDDDEAIHIVMEHVDAPSLQELVDRDGPLAPERVAAIGLEVVEALAAAHAAGIVHRDVKPSNVLVADGGAQVTDFGIASVTGDTSALTMSGQALGTPDYVSPEQIRGDEAGPHTDLWSLGATLFMAVEGTPPFHRDRPVSTVHAVVHDEPRPMARAGALAPVLHAMLAKDPGARPSLAEVRARLEEVVDGTAGATATAGMAPVERERTRQLPPVAPGPTTPASPTETSPPPPEPNESTSRTGEPTAAPPPRARRGATAGLALLAVAVLVIGAIVVAALSTRDGAPSAAAPSPTDSAEGTDTPSAQPTAAPTPSEEGSPSPTATSPSPSPTPTGTPTTTSAGDVPAGWEVYEGPTYEVAHPAGWTTRDAEAPNNIDLVAPDGTDGYLRVAHTDEPAEDVVRDTERIEAAFREDHAGYQRIRLGPTDYRDTEAAIWEYTFTADGQTYHAIHLNLSTGEYGYALNHVVPDEGWEEAAGRFDQFTRSFSYP